MWVLFIKREGVVYKMDTRVEDLTDWKLWFKNELVRYKKWIAYLIVIMFINISLMLYVISVKKSSIGWFLVLPLIYSLIQFIAFFVRKNDVEKLLAASLDLTETKTVTVNKLNGKEINGDYCYNYAKACGTKFKLGYKYKITYLKNTMGKYIIDWLELGDESYNIEKHNYTLDIQEKKSIDTNNIVNNKTDLKEELEKRGLDIEEIKKDIYGRSNKTLEESISVDVEKILNRKGKSSDKDI